ncbi:MULTISPECIES: hypothetical protein [unclassified Streptomyces]|uniref:hypothetical protein n=1 Tax=unclassified Streptomyces TaxID=2593676 RepID=UPI002E2BB0B3|nr:hypothetical protein [Streptomyces sp. NBC_00228]
MTTTTKAEPAEDTEEIAPPLPRGRHRRPRPRKILLAVGGLAVAAGVLSLVRLAPESGVGGLGTAEAEPSPDATQSADRPANAAATIRADPTAIPSTIPSATSVMGGESATPTTTSGVVPTPYATTAHPPAEVHPPAVPETPAAATPAPEAPAPHPTSSTAPEPTPAPSRPANSPSPAPSRPRLCVPIIGLCVDGLANHSIP